MLEHPIQEKLYHLYLDASDKALGCVLQQVQVVKVKELQGTKYYEWLKKAFESQLEVPKLVMNLPAALEDVDYKNK